MWQIGRRSIARISPGSIPPYPSSCICAWLFLSPDAIRLQPCHTASGPCWRHVPQYWVAAPAPAWIGVASCTVACTFAGNTPASAHNSGAGLSLSGTAAKWGGKHVTLSLEASICLQKRHVWPCDKHSKVTVEVIVSMTKWSGRGRPQHIGDDLGRC